MRRANWKQAHPEENRAYQKAYRQKHKRRLSEQNKDWRQRNIEHVRRYNANYKAEHAAEIAVRRKEINQTEAFRIKNRLRVKRWIERNAERHRLTRLKYYHRNRHRIQQARRDKKNRNPEDHLKRIRAYREKNREAIRARQKRWAKANPEAYRLYARNRRVRKRGLPVEHARIKAFIRHVKKLKSVPCYYCGTRLSKNEITIEHIVPIQNKGGHTSDNVCVCCSACNCSKKNTPLTKWQTPRLNQFVLAL